MFDITPGKTIKVLEIKPNLCYPSGHPLNFRPRIHVDQLIELLTFLCENKCSDRLNGAVCSFHVKWNSDMALLPPPAKQGKKYPRLKICFLQLRNFQFRKPSTTP